MVMIILQDKVMIMLQEIMRYVYEIMHIFKTIAG